MSGWSDIAAAAGAPLAAHGATKANPTGSQHAWLQELLQRNADTTYGRRHGFDSLRGYADYTSRVPIVSYEDIAPEIDAIAEGAPRVLTTEPVIGFEETSGSTSGRKLIPYTASGLRDFESAALIWLHQLAEACPEIAKGKIYWSISPAARHPSRVKSGLPIGFASDAGYFSETTGAALATLSAVPLQAGGVADIASWRFLTLRCLLACRNLRFISVWSPTFLTLLLEAIWPQADNLLAAIHDGRPGCDVPFAHRCEPDPARARELARALPAKDARQLWPKLALVSAWAHGPAAPHFAALQRTLPEVLFDGKGLMATEGVVSISHPRDAFPVPAFGVNLIEFLGDDGRAYLAHELEPQGRYRIVITTRSGLYRYDLGDLVICRGINRGIPRIEFIGRAGIVSDLVGEKLDEAFVAAAIRATGIEAILAPLPSPQARYLLLVDAEAPAAISADLEQRLAANPHYAYARRLGQLSAIEPRRCRRLKDLYHRFRLEQGQRLGDIKPPALLHDSRDTMAFLAFLASRSQTIDQSRPATRRLA